MLIPHTHSVKQFSQAALNHTSPFVSFQPRGHSHFCDLRDGLLAPRAHSSSLFLNRIWVTLFRAKSTWFRTSSRTGRPNKCPKIYYNNRRELFSEEVWAFLQGEKKKKRCFSTIKLRRRAFPASSIPMISPSSLVGRRRALRFHVSCRGASGRTSKHIAQTPKPQESSGLRASPHQPSTANDMLPARRCPSVVAYLRQKKVGGERSFRADNLFTL